MEATEAASVSSEPDLLCGACGYNLRGVPSDRCPECGRHFDPNHSIANLIPWEQRRYIGRLGAFWRTAWISSQPRRLVTYMDWPMSRSAARMFHFWVIMIAAAGISTIPPTFMTLWPRLSQTGKRLGQIEVLNAFLINPEAAVITGAALL